VERLRVLRQTDMLIVPAPIGARSSSKDATAPSAEGHTTPSTSAAKQSSTWTAARDDYSVRCVTGQEKWRYTPRSRWLPALPGDRSDVISWRADWRSAALDARSGQGMLRRALGGPAGGGLVTYSARGKQNVASFGLRRSIQPSCSEIGGGNTLSRVRLPSM